MPSDTQYVVEKRRKPRQPDSRAHYGFPPTEHSPWARCVFKVLYIHDHLYCQFCEFSAVPRKLKVKKVRPGQRMAFICLLTCCRNITYKASLNSKAAWSRTRLWGWWSVRNGRDSIGFGDKHSNLVSTSPSFMALEKVWSLTEPGFPQEYNDESYVHPKGCCEPQMR